MCETPEETKDAGKPTITYDDFCKLDLKVGTIVESGEHPNADRLIVLQVDLGDEKRQIIAGIKAYYAPEALLGKQVVVVTNLVPRKMRGLESNGMILAASAKEGEELTDVVVLTPDKPVPAGSSVS
jgi:methionine--tRNA ligase beta chain